MDNISKIINRPEIFLIIAKAIFIIFIVFPIINSFMLSLIEELVDRPSDYLEIFVAIVILYGLFSFQSFKYKCTINTKYYIGLIFFYMGHLVLAYIYYITHNYPGPGVLSGIIYLMFVVPMLVMYSIASILIHCNGVKVNKT